MRPRESEQIHRLTGMGGTSAGVTRRRLVGGALAAGAALSVPALRWRETAAKQDGGNLSFWRLTGAGPNEDIPASAADRLAELHPDVEVDIQEFQNDPFKTKLRAALGGSNPPDIWNTWGGGVLATYVNEGVVLDITDELAKDGWQDRFAPALLDLLKVNDRYYGVPVVANSVFFWYNRDILQGETPPATWDELIQTVKDLKAEGIIPIALANKTKWPGAFYLNYLVMRINGTDFLNNVMAGEASFDDPGVIEAGRRIQELAEAGAFPDGFNGLDYDTGGSRQLVYAERAAMELQGTWYPSQVQSEFPDIIEKLDFFAFPPVPDGIGDPTSLLGGVSPAYAISQKSDVPEAAVDMLRLATDDVARDIVVEAGRIPAMTGATFPDEQTNQIATRLAEAASIQLFWDQALPPELGQAQLDVSQGLLSLDITPEEAAKQLEEVAAGLRSQ